MQKFSRKFRSAGSLRGTCMRRQRTDSGFRGNENLPPYSGSQNFDHNSESPPLRPARGIKPSGSALSASRLSGGELLAFRGGAGAGTAGAGSNSSHMHRDRAGTMRQSKIAASVLSPRAGERTTGVYSSTSPSTKFSWDRPASARSGDIEALLTRQGAAQIEQLDLSACSLSSLSHYRTAMVQLRCLRHLDISQNLITSLRPIRALPALETINCSNNNLKILDGLEDCPQLAAIIAADNMIASLGDLRQLAQLRSLGLRGNALSSIAVLPHHLPPALHSLDVANNELTNLSDLRYVSSLMELRRLDLRANPLTSLSHMKDINYRPFVVFLLPRLSLLDNTPITRDEWTASRGLFSDQPGELSEALMTLLQPANEKQLRVYLAEKSPAGLAPNTGKSQGAPADAENGALRQQQQQQQPRTRLAPPGSKSAASASGGGEGVEAEHRGADRRVGGGEVSKQGRVEAVAVRQGERERARGGGCGSGGDGRVNSQGNRGGELGERQQRADGDALEAQGPGYGGDGGGRNCDGEVAAHLGAAKGRALLVRGSERGGDGQAYNLEGARGGERGPATARELPFLVVGDFDGDGGGAGGGGEGEVAVDGVDVGLLSRHVKEMRKYFKAYIKSQSKRRASSAETLQRALRAHWARQVVVRRWRGLATTDDESKVAGGARRVTQLGGGEGERDEGLRLSDVHTCEVVGGLPSRGMRMSIRHVCAVRIEAVARGMLVRRRIRRWRDTRAHAAFPSQHPHSKPVVAANAQHVLDENDVRPGTRSSQAGGGGGGGLPAWVVRPGDCGAGSAAGLSGIEKMAKALEVLKAELEEERAARRKQDEALRVLWNEVAGLRLAEQRKAALRIQKVWRGHDDRALFAVAVSHFRKYQDTRHSAARCLQRVARKWCFRAFGNLFLRRWLASLLLQRVFRGHRVRRMQDSSLKIKYVQLESEIRWLRDVEVLRLERTLSSLQDALDHVLEAVAPLTPSLPATLSQSDGFRRCRPELRDSNFDADVAAFPQKDVASSMLSSNADSPRPLTPDPLTPDMSHTDELPTALM